jgi:prepilin-type processing-associated H-X9-DG protein/prepilin-type N-terminal cleavage/methylation domain-containing protein
MGRFSPGNSKAMGFTLIELLIVLTLVAVLSALLLTSIASVRASADVAESVSHLRQWGVALSLYVADNDGSLPRRGQGVQPLAQISRPTDWFNALPPYLGSASYQNLVASGRKPKAGDKSIFISPGCADPGGQYFLSYAMNMNLSPWNLPDPSMMSQIANAAFVVFMAEAPGQYSSTYPSRNPYSVAAPHRGKGNVLFLDGHVQTLTASYLGCGVGDPQHSEVSWLTGTASDAQASSY